MTRYMVRLFRRFFVNRDGNFALIFAVIIVPLVGMVGMSIDFIRVLDYKERIQTIADAAVLAALNPNSLAHKERLDVGKNYSSAMWAEVAKDDFLAQVRSLDPSLTVDTKIIVSKSDNDLLSELSYSVSIPTTFSRTLGVGDIEIGGAVRARSAPPVFKDFHILVDNSPSMGIGATPLAIYRMERKMGCAFACHTLDGTSKNNLPRAIGLGVPLRIDVVRSGLNKIAETISQTRTQPDLYRTALYSLGTRAETHVNYKAEELVHLTSDMDELRAGSQKLGLMIMPADGYNSFGLTDVSAALKTFSPLIGTPGNGETAATPQQYVIMITDGVQNKWRSPTCETNVFGDRRCIEYMPQEVCTSVKNRGIKIAVLYTRYVELRDDTYVKYVKPFADRIPLALKACATQNLFFEVAPDEGIPEAMQELFAKLTATPILTD